MQRERNILAMVWRNFRESLITKPRKGIRVGQDHLGTSYYEIAADPQRGKRRPARWFETVEEKFDQEIPAEWEAWLRGRRDEPPTNEEVSRSLALAQQKKIKGEELDAKEKRSPDNTITTNQKSNFPKREEYEVFPGKPSAK